MKEVKDLLVIISKTSGAQRNVRPEIEAALKKYGLSYSVKRSKHPPHQLEILEKYRTGFAAVAVYGGDGSVIAALKFLANTNKPLLVFPGGTGNFIAKSFGLDTNFKRTIRAYAKKTYHSYEFDIASLNNQKLALDIHNGWWAQATLETPTKLKKKIGAIAYAIAAFKTLPKASQQTYTLTIDGKQRKLKGLTMIIANQPIQNFFGLQLFLSPHRPGIIQVAVLRRLSPLRIFLWLTGRKWLGHDFGSFMRTYSGNEVIVESASDKMLYDDQTADLALPITITGGKYTTKVILPPVPKANKPLRRFQILSKLNLVLVRERLRNFIAGNPSYKYSQLSPHIYLGGRYKESAYKTFRKWGITGVVNMRSTPPAKPPKGFSILHLPTKDWRAPDSESLSKGVEFIEQQVKNGGGVYIHCRQGEGRGPTMAAAYLVSQGLSVDQAIDHIRKMRPMAHPNKLQVKQLRAWTEKYTKQTKNSK